MFDIAFDPSGQLYGIDSTSNLYKIDSTNGATTFIGGLGTFANSLEFRNDGVLFAAGFNSIYTVDVNTGVATPVFTLPSQHSAAGDIAFDALGNLYLTTLDGALIRLSADLATWSSVGSTGFSDFFGLIYGSDEVLYGFRDAQQIYKINLQDASTTFVGNITDAGVHGVTGAATDFKPNPEANFLSFPLAGLTPFTAKISAVLDHSVQLYPSGGGPWFYHYNTVVTAFTNEQGVLSCGLKHQSQCFDMISANSVGYRNTKNSAFEITGNGNYTGGGCPNKLPCSHFLYYTGHSGYDYPAHSDGSTLGVGKTQIVAPADGILFIPSQDPIASYGNPTGAVDKFDIMAIDHRNGYVSWFLHVGCQPGTKLRRVPCDKSDTYDYRGMDATAHRIPGCDIATLRSKGCPVKRGNPIGLVGNKGLAAKTSTAHLHYEVRAGFTNTDTGLPVCERPDCVPIDPYGWAPLPSICPDPLTPDCADPYLKFLPGSIESPRLWQ